MGKVQKQLHVEHQVPPAAHKVHHLPARHDTLRREREPGDGCAVGYASNASPEKCIRRMGAN
jgi:hypothetical protein